MATLFGLYPFLLELYADGGYQGEQFQRALKTIIGRLNLEIVKRSDQAKRFVVLPKRWIAERTSPGWDAVAGSPRIRPLLLPLEMAAHSKPFIAVRDKHLVVKIRRKSPPGSL